MSDISDNAISNENAPENHENKIKVETREETKRQEKEVAEEQHTNLVDVYDENASNASPRRLPQQHQQQQEGRHDDISEGDQSFDLDSSVIAHDENVDPDPENSIRSDKSREERRAEVASGLSADGGGVLKELVPPSPPATPPTTDPSAHTSSSSHNPPHSPSQSHKSKPKSKSKPTTTATTSSTSATTTLHTRRRSRGSSDATSNSNSNSHNNSNNNNDANHSNVSSPRARKSTTQPAETGHYAAHTFASRQRIVNADEDGVRHDEHHLHHDGKPVWRG